MDVRLLAAPLTEAHRVDLAIYSAVARTRTPVLDGTMGRLSRAADHSKLSIGAAAVLAATGGSRGRSAAAAGLASVAVTSAVCNLVLKPLGRRRRPDHVALRVPLARRVVMPKTSSFPSGHSASAFAFAEGVGQVMPAAALPLRFLATMVAYSRVHTGVHYPGDVVVGSVLGAGLAQVVATRGMRAPA